MSSINQKEYLKRYLAGGDAAKKKKKKKSKNKSSESKGIMILDNDLGDLRNIPFGEADVDEAPTIAEITYDSDKTKMKEEMQKMGDKWKQTLGDLNKENDNSIVTTDDFRQRHTRHDSGDSPPRNTNRHDSDDESPSRKCKQESTVFRSSKIRHDSDDSPPRKIRHDSDESPVRKGRHDSDESPVRKNRYDSDESPPRKASQDSDESPPRKPAMERIEKKITTREYLIARKRGKLKKDSEEDIARKERESKLQKAAEEKHKHWNKGVAQVQLREERTADIRHEMSKSFARSSQDEDMNTMYKARIREDDPMLEYFSKKTTKKNDGPAKPLYQGPFPLNRFNMRPGYRWDGVDRSNGFEKEYFAKQANNVAIEEDAYKYCAEDM